MAESIKLIVGLGNPGPDYQNTRHNAGAWFIEALCYKYNLTLKKETKFHGLVTKHNFGGHTCHLLIPTTFMNLSGQAIQAVARFYKILPDEILVAHDELDFAPGTIRLKKDGGHGGHNGLRDTKSHLGTDKFYRLRIGIGHPGNKNAVHGYVLKNPNKEDHISIRTAIDKAIDMLPLILNAKIDEAMNQLHSEN